MINSNSYTIKKLENGRFQIVKVLNEYSSKKEAAKQLIRLGTTKHPEKIEKELIKEYISKKDL